MVAFTTTPQRGGSEERMQLMNRGYKKFNSVSFYLLLFVCFCCIQSFFQSMSSSERLRVRWCVGCHLLTTDKQRKSEETAAGEGRKEVQSGAEGRRKKDKEVSRPGCGAGEGSSWHLTVRHVFLIVLVLRRAILRSLLYAKTWKTG